VAKPKAPRWLTEAFRDGVDERDLPHFDDGPPAPVVPLVYAGANPACWLAQHDPIQHPCSGPIERFHFIPRQRVENAMWDALLWAKVGWQSPLGWRELPLERAERWAIVHVAAWDARNGGLGCEHHHRRLDAHAGSPSAPKIVVPFADLPGHVYEFVDERGFRGVGWLTQRFPA